MAGTTIASLLVVLGLDPRPMMAGAAAASKSATSMGGVLTKVGATGALAIGVVGAAAVKLGYDFDKSFSRISAISNASAGDIEKWKDQVLGLAGQTAQAPQELADALFFLASAGLDANQVMPTLELSAKAAASGLGSVTDVAKITANALNAYAGSGLTAAQVTDALVAAVREGSAEPEEFAGALGRILPIAAKARVSFDEVTASLASLSNIGLDVNEGVTAMRGLLNALEAPGSQAAKALADVGISTEQMRKTISQEGILGALRMLEEATGGNIDVMRKIVPNIRAMTGAFGLTGQEAEKVNDIFLAVKDSTGALNEAFATTAETASFKMDKALNDINVELTRLGAEVLPVAATGLSMLAQTVTYISGQFTGGDEAVTGMISSTEAAVAAWEEGTITATQLIDTLTELEMQYAGQISIQGELGDAIVAAAEAEEREIDIRKSAEAGLHSYMNVIEQLDDAYQEVAPAAEEAAEAGRKLPKELRESLMGELPAIRGTIVKYKDAFSLSPGELVKITRTWAQIGETIADDMRTILNSDLKPRVKEAILALPPEMRHAWVEGNRSERSHIEKSIRETYKIEDQINKMVTQARVGGSEVGSALDAGLIKGIVEGSPAVSAAAAQAVRDAIRAARVAAGAESPSKVMAALGRDLGAGLVQGLSDSLSSVIDAMKELIGKGLTQAQLVAARGLDDMANDLERRLTKLADKIDSFRSDIRQAFEFDLVGGLMGLEELTAANATAFLTEQVTNAQSFARALTQLQEAGLGAAGLRDIASQGVGALPLAELLLANPELLASFESASATIGDLAGDTMNKLVNEVFGDAIERAGASVDRLERRLERFAEMLGREDFPKKFEDLARALERALDRLTGRLGRGRGPGGADGGAPDLGLPKPPDLGMGWFGPPIEVHLHGSSLESLVDRVDEGLAVKGRHNVSLVHHSN